MLGLSRRDMDFANQAAGVVVVIDDVERTTRELLIADEDWHRPVLPTPVRRAAPAGARSRSASKGGQTFGPISHRLSSILGTVFAFGGIPPHLHLALVEIIGGVPNGQYQGVDLYRFFLDTANTDTVTAVTFMQDGSPPTPGDGSTPGPKVYHLDQIRGIQDVLGFDPGPIDGLDGPKTQAAVSAFQETNGLTPDGVCAGDTLAALASAMTDRGFEVDGV
jgi:Putative peptidoglycan binding domain